MRRALACARKSYVKARDSLLLTTFPPSLVIAAQGLRASAGSAPSLLHADAQSFVSRVLATHVLQVWFIFRSVLTFVRLCSALRARRPLFLSLFGPSQIDQALDDMIKWLNEGGRVGIYDATNHTSCLLYTSPSPRD